MSAASAAWRALQDALATSTPSCAGDDRFTSETAERDAVLLEICRACPIREQCAAYARAAPVTDVWGYFGGVSRRRKRFSRDRRGAKAGGSAVSQKRSSDERTAPDLSPA